MTEIIESMEEVFVEGDIYFLPAIVDDGKETIQSFFCGKPCYTFQEAENLIPNMLEQFSLNYTANVAIIEFKKCEEAEKTIELIAIYRRKALH